MPLLLSAAVLPASAVAAGSGGGGLSGSPGSGPTGGGAAQPVPAVVQAGGNGITLSTAPSALLRRPETFTGSVSPARRGWVVEVERRGGQTGGRWQATTHGSVRSDGSFTAVWPANHIGRFDIRAVLEPRAAAASRATATSPALTITVYKPAIATIYGPGFWGSRTACGQILRRNTLGVAHRTLPCGTKVSLLWHGRSITVSVIDRGPYANHADWDLTAATASALKMDGTATIGAVSLPR